MYIIYTCIHIYTYYILYVEYTPLSLQATFCQSHVTATSKGIFSQTPSCNYILLSCSPPANFLNVYNLYGPVARVWRFIQTNNFPSSLYVPSRSVLRNRNSTYNYIIHIQALLTKSRQH